MKFIETEGQQKDIFDLLVKAGVKDLLVNKNDLNEQQKETMNELYTLTGLDTDLSYEDFLLTLFIENPKILDMLKDPQHFNKLVDVQQINTILRKRTKINPVLALILESLYNPYFNEQVLKIYLEGESIVDYLRLKTDQDVQNYIAGKSFIEHFIRNKEMKTIRKYFENYLPAAPGDIRIIYIDICCAIAKDLNILDILQEEKKADIIRILNESGKSEIILPYIEQYVQKYIAKHIVDKNKKHINQDKLKNIILKIENTLGRSVVNISPEIYEYDEQKQMKFKIKDVKDAIQNIYDVLLDAGEEGKLDSFINIVCAYFAYKAKPTDLTIKDRDMKTIERNKKRKTLHQIPIDKQYAQEIIDFIQYVIRLDGKNVIRLDGKIKFIPKNKAKDMCKYINSQELKDNILSHVSSNPTNDKFSRILKRLEQVK